ncbi:nucleoside deaminase [Paraburkholderia aspalathi]
MALAIEQARRNPMYPFGAVIVNESSGKILARGVNKARENPMLHGEMVAMNEYVSHHGNRGWADATLYTTGEPCSMCMSAIVWTGIGGVVWASSIDAIRSSGIGQIDLKADEVVSRSTSFYHPRKLVSGVLADQTDQLFINRVRA